MPPKKDGYAFEKRQYPYLEKRRRKWYAVMEIPKDVRHQFPASRPRKEGEKPKPRTRFVQSLDTETRSIAERKVLRVIANWKRKIAIAKGEPVDDEMVNDAEDWRRALLGAKNDEQRQSILEQINDAAWDIGAINVKSIGDPPSSDPEARDFYARATGQLVDFTTHLDEWLSTSNSTAKTQHMQRTDVERFASKFQLVQDVTRPSVRRWVDKLMIDDQLAPATVQRMLSGLRGYWRYLQTIGVAGEDDEPFSKLDVARRAKRKSPQSARQPFEPDDMVQLLDEAVKREDKRQQVRR